MGLQDIFAAFLTSVVDGVRTANSYVPRHLRLPIYGGFTLGLYTYYSTKRTGLKAQAEEGKYWNQFVDAIEKKEHEEKPLKEKLKKKAEKEEREKTGWGSW